MALAISASPKTSSIIPDLRASLALTGIPDVIIDNAFSTPANLGNL